MCKLFKVSRSCYYNWIKRGSVVNKVDEEFNKLIESIFEQSRATYGTRRIKEVLKQRFGFITSRRKIQKSLQQLDLRVKMKRKFRITTTSKHTLPIEPNILNRDFYRSNADETYVGDITYIPTKQGWWYLAVVIDVYSRKVVGWSMDDSMRTSLVNDALNMAIVQSMSRKGNCWDNAVAESFFHSLKTELIHHETFYTKAQANEKIFEYIEIFYNRQRIHSSNNYMSPNEYEEKMLRLEMVG